MAIPSSKSNLKIVLHSPSIESQENLKLFDSQDDDNRTGYTCEFTTKPPVELICQKCKYVSRNPTLTSCCGNHFCKGCISPLYESHQGCPSCGQVDFNLMLNKRDYKQISLLQVFCTKRSRGCKWIGQLEQLEAHTDVKTGDCMYVSLQCPSNCGEKVERKDLDKHLLHLCPLREYSCVHCNFKGTFKTVTEVHWPKCGNLPVECPNKCGVTCEKTSLKSHLNTCSNVGQFCSFSFAGCNRKLIRENRERHMIENGGTHLSLLAEFTRKMNSEIEKIAKEHKEWRDILRKKELKLLNSIHEQELGLEKLQSKVTALEERCQHLEKTQEKYHSDELRDLKDKVCELLYNTGHAPWVPATFTMPYFEKLRQTDKSWYSPTVYTHHGGYLFLIAVRPNGRPLGFEGHGTHVSVHYKPKKGDYDRFLKWPVKVTVTLQLLNQHADRDHLTKIAMFRYGKEMTTSAYAVGPFDDELIAHNKLSFNVEKGTQYLKNDCLQFRIVEIDVGF